MKLNKSILSLLLIICILGTTNIQAFAFESSINPSATDTQIKTKKWEIIIKKNNGTNLGKLIVTMTGIYSTVNNHYELLDFDYVTSGDELTFTCSHLETNKKTIYISYNNSIVEKFTFSFKSSGSMVITPTKYSNKQKITIYV